MDVLRPLAITVAVISICSISIFYVQKVVSADYELYKAESVCVAKIIKKGRTHRKDIWTKDGLCGVKK
jgi:hypothetical protein